VAAPQVARSVGNAPLTDWGMGILDRPPTPPGRGACHLWPVPITDDWVVTGPLEICERRQAARYLVHRARQTFVASRVAQRLIGGHYLGQVAQEVAIDRRCQSCAADHGRPRWVGNHRLDYSVSHAGDWLLVAVVGSGLVGVDVAQRGDAERVGPTQARKALTPAERRRWMQLPPQERTEGFYQTWCRKEAAVKLTGSGLRIRPSSVDVSKPTVSLPEAPPPWSSQTIWLRQLRAPTAYSAALATTVSCHKIHICGPLTSLLTATHR